MSDFIIHGFENTYWIIIGLIIWIGVILFILLKEARTNFLEDELLSQVYGRNSLWYKTYRAIIFIICALFFIILAGPYSNVQIEKIQKNGIDIEIVFDLSYSMIATDLSPTRLEVAKQVLWDFIAGIESDRIGVILFSGKPFQSVPLTHDYNFVSNFIEDIRIDTINQQHQNLQGTAIWDGLVLASDVLLSSEPEREKVIILITDWEANRGVKPELALKLLKQEGIKTYSIWVWKQWQTSIDVPTWFWFNQKVLVSWVDEEILKKIAEETGGEYFRADSLSTFSSILSTIWKLEKSKLEIEVIQFHNSQRSRVLYVLLLCFWIIWYIVFFKKIKLS